MSSEQLQPQHGEQDEETPDPLTPGAGGTSGGANVQAADDLLDEIDSVLESNAEEFVRGFVQKGGQ